MKQKHNNSYQTISRIGLKLGFGLGLGFVGVKAGIVINNAAEDACNQRPDILLSSKSERVRQTGYY